MYSSTLTLVLISIFIKTSISNKCNSFQNVTVTLYTQEGNHYDDKVTGCIERIAFNNKIFQVHVKNQNLTRLGQDSIRNMLHLTTAIFEKNSIEVIEPSAFRNVPNLSTLKIRFERISIVPRKVFSMMPKLQMWKLSYNRIQQVEDGAFGNVDTLEVLYCDHNELREWKKKWFTNSTNLKVLNFSHNRIRIVPRDAFTDFPLVEKINFDLNQLEVIEAEAFNGVRTLQYLGLKYNRIKSIHPRVFPNAITVNSFALDANYLSFLPRKMMVAVTPKQMSIYGNPWKCPCLDQILFWLNDANATVAKSNKCLGEDIPVCSFPSSFSRTCREVVEEEVISTYLDQLRKIDPPLEKYCARLD